MMLRKLADFKNLSAFSRLFLAQVSKNGNEKCTTIIIEKCTTLPKTLQIAPLFPVILPLLLCFLPLFEIQILQKLQFFAAFCLHFCYFCAMKKKINYNPALTIAENARKNGVTEDAIRYYIKANNINRRKEAAVRIINACRKVLAEQPDLTPYKVAHEIGASVNTVKNIGSWLSAKTKLNCQIQVIKNAKN